MAFFSFFGFFFWAKKPKKCIYTRCKKFYHSEKMKFWALREVFGWILPWHFMFRVILQNIDQESQKLPSVLKKRPRTKRPAPLHIIRIIHNQTAKKTIITFLATKNFRWIQKEIQELCNNNMLDVENAQLFSLPITCVAFGSASWHRCTIHALASRPAHTIRSYLIA